MNILELQKTLDKFPNPDFSLDSVGTQMRVLLYDEWLKDFKEKFVVFQRELEQREKMLASNDVSDEQRFPGWRCLE